MLQDTNTRAASDTTRRTFTTVADNQQTVQFPVFQGERVNCEDNTSLGEFTLAPVCTTLSSASGAC